MNDVKNLCAEYDSSLFGRLPEDIVLQILNKLIDLKTLCLCKLVSKRFTSIVSQVETIALTFSTYPLLGTPSLGSYGSAIGSLMTFQCVKSLRIQLPSSFDNHILFKWKVNFRIRPDSFIFLSPNSVCNNKESNVNENNQEAQEELDQELIIKKAGIMVECWKDAMMRVMLLLHVTRLPLLKNIVITDLGKRGKVSLSGGKVDDLKDWMSSSSDEIIGNFYSSYFVSRCYVPLLKLPVSGYLMKGVKLYILQWNDPMDDSFMKSDNDDAFDDKEEAAYSEALMEIFKKHSDRIERLDL